jgi:hypothetical protein
MFPETSVGFQKSTMSYIPEDQMLILLVYKHVEHSLAGDRPVARPFLTHDNTSRRQEVLGRTNSLFSFHTIRIAYKTNFPTKFLFLRLYTLPL